VKNDLRRTGGPGGTESPQNKERRLLVPLRGSPLESDGNRSVIHLHWDLRANEAYGLVPAFSKTRGLRPLEHPWVAYPHE